MKVCLNKQNGKEVFDKVFASSTEYAEDLSGNLYLDVNSVVLSEDENKRLQATQKEVVKLFRDIQSIIRLNPALLEWLGIPEILHEEALKERITNLTSYGRFDWLLDKEGNFRLIEFNAETPFGWKETIDYQQGLHQYFNEFTNMNINTNVLLKKSVEKSLHEQGFSESDRVAIIGDLMDEEEYKTFNILRREIGYNCKDLFIDSIAKLKAMNDEIYLLNNETLYPIDFLQTFYSCEWMAYDEGGNDFVNALKSGKVKLINPASTLILHSKGLFALMWYLYTEEGLLQEHSDTIENVIPYTSFLESEFIEENKFVAKPLNYREGNGVQIREEVSEIEDDNLIYQEYVDSIELEYPISDINFNRKVEMLKPTIGTYLINDEFGGYFTRLSKEICSTDFVVFAATFVGE